MLIFDAHLDLSMNAMEWNRDIRLPLVDIRRSELGMTDKPDRTRNTVSLPEMRSARVGSNHREFPWRVAERPLFSDRD